MTMTPVEIVPVLRALPVTLPRVGAIEIELNQGVLIFRMSKTVQERIEELLEKQRESKLSAGKDEEMDQYDDVD